VTLNFGKSKFTLQKKFLAFFGIVPLLIATAWIPVPCPACHGEGMISNHGMVGVTVVEKPLITKSTSWLIVCDSWLMYQMEILLTLQNDGDQDAYGLIELYLTDVISNYISDMQVAAVSVSKGKTAQQKVTVMFTIPLEYSRSSAPTIVAKVPNDYCVCRECNGMGSIMLNALPLTLRKWELHNNHNMVWEHTTDAPPFEELEGGYWAIEVDSNGDPVLDDNGNPQLVWVYEFDH